MVESISYTHLALMWQLVFWYGIYGRYMGEAEDVENYMCHVDVMFQIYQAVVGV